MPSLATFAMGCFWKPQVIFDRVKGVKKTEVGYIGGQTENPSYQAVCTDTTGHAEALQVSFDPDEVTYEELLKIFWESHNPTTMNRQGPDIGSQYRSAIFTHSEEQHEAAERSKQALETSGKYSSPIVTQIIPAGTFYPAEEYHQKYLEKRGMESCSI